jgi:hypothetical protein
MTVNSTRLPSQILGEIIAGVFAVAIILVIAFFVLDEVTARFSAIAISAAIVVLTQPAARLGVFKTRR